MEFSAELNALVSNLWDESSAAWGKKTKEESDALCDAVTFVQQATIALDARDIQDYLQAVHDYVLEPLRTGQNMGMSRVRQELDKVVIPARKEVYKVTDRKTHKLNWYTVLGGLVFLENAGREEPWDLLPVIKKQPQHAKLEISTVAQMRAHFSPAIEELSDPGTALTVVHTFAMSLMLAALLADVPGLNRTTAEAFNTAFTKYCIS